jgi:alanine dehydrogenase
MRVAVPTEIKSDEARVGLTPDGARELVAAGHDVYVQAGAGAGCSMTDDAYLAAGARMVADVDELFAMADLLVKVKEPQLSEVARLRPGQILFTYLHLAAYPAIAQALADSGVTAVAYETVQLEDGSLPLLAPMSEIAGRMAAQVGARFLERPQGGRGVLLGGAPGVPPAAATVLGAGRAGAACAVALAGLGAVVTVVDNDIEKLRKLEDRGQGRIQTKSSSLQAVEDLVTESDLVVGAVLIAGAAAPKLVSAGLVSQMRPGSVLVDISIDQGGAFATSHETTHADPVFELHGVVHYAVGNIPGAVPYTSTLALTNATLRYVVALAAGLESALTRIPELAYGVNVNNGEIKHPAVSAALRENGRAHAGDPVS